MMAPRIPDCPLAHAVARIGEWWTLELLHDAWEGHTHAAHFAESLRTPRDVLAERLATLVAGGLLRRVPCAAPGCDEDGTGADVPHDRYLLTDRGRGLRPLLLAMAAWVNQDLAPEERGLVLVDAATRQEAEPVLVDRRTGRRVDTAAYVLVPGPAASREMRARYEVIDSRREGPLRGDAGG
ncbi:winged helix-turn-helix transcriptional regulator [Streptomyces sp. NPDC087300]|uniref:winged helix-turn-helix transcriptional regulator n=1 Tax=Streptomyces sp. NPDC087300 TaxID=3365780 RepID=UPI0038145147